jgi:hypothetical protein
MVGVLASASVHEIAESNGVSKGFSEIQTLLGHKETAGSIASWRSFLSYRDGGRSYQYYTSVIFPAHFVGVPCFVVGRMLFYSHMPIRGVVVNRSIHLGAQEENLRRDIEVK